MLRHKLFVFIFSLFCIVNREKQATFPPHKHHKYSMELLKCPGTPPKKNEYLSLHVCIMEEGRSDKATAQRAS